MACKVALGTGRLELRAPHGLLEGARVRVTYHPAGCMKARRAHLDVEVAEPRLRGLGELLRRGVRGPCTVGPRGVVVRLDSYEPGLALVVVARVEGLRCRGHCRVVGWPRVYVGLPRSCVSRRG